LELKQKGVWLQKVLKIKRYYQDPDLNLRSLAEKLDLHPNELSRIINTVLKKSFNDLINEYRVGEVVRKMQDPAYDHITLLGIALESGFNSQSTFTRIFKNTTGKSPLEYKNNQKKDCPSYNLGSYYRPTTLISNHETTPGWSHVKSNRNLMLKNYFKTAWRNLMRNKSYATINVTGLAIGIAACLLIFLIVQFETSFDNYHTHKDRIYRIVTVNSGPDGTHAGPGTPLPLTEGMRLDFPKIKQLANIMKNDGSHYVVGAAGNGGLLKKFKVDLAYYTEPEFFRIFDFKWLAGDKNTALTEPNTMVLSRDEADKFFGDWHTAMGKIVRYENKRDLKVTGIIERTPVNTDFPMKLAISWVTLLEKGGDLNGNAKDWVSIFSDKHTYMILPTGTNEKRLNTDLAAFAKKYVPAPYNKNEIFQLQAIKIDKVWVVVDCGWYVNPDIIKAQVEGSVLMALGAATIHEITFKDGMVEQRNFYDYKMPRITDMPLTEVHIMDNDENAGGMGEPGFPAFAPALTNAIFDLTGKRIRKLPFDMTAV